MNNYQYIINLNTNIFFNQPIFNEVDLIEYVEYCYSNIIQYDDSVSSIVDHMDEYQFQLYKLVQPTIYKLFRYYDTTISYSDLEEQIIRCILKIILTIEEYVKTSLIIDKAELNNIDIKIVDKKSGIIVVTPYFAPMIL